jgi:hypothetical protein
MQSTTSNVVALRPDPEPAGFAQARDAWLSRCLADRRFPHSAKTLCARVSLYFNSDHFKKTGGDLLAWPKWETLVAETGLSKRSIARLLKHLERLGAFEVEHGRYDHKTKKRARNRYLVRKSKVTLVTPDQGDSGGTRLYESTDSMNLKKEKEEDSKIGLPRGPKAPEKESKPSADSSKPFRLPKPLLEWRDRLDEPPLLTGEERAALGRLKKGAA